MDSIAQTHAAPADRFTAMRSTNELTITTTL